MEEYFFAIATGALAAMSLALWLRLKSLSKQQEEIFEVSFFKISILCVKIQKSDFHPIRYKRINFN